MPRVSKLTSAETTSAAPVWRYDATDHCTVCFQSRCANDRLARLIAEHKAEARTIRPGCLHPVMYRSLGLWTAATR